MQHYLVEINWLLVFAGGHLSQHKQALGCFALDRMKHFWYKYAMFRRKLRIGNFLLYFWQPAGCLLHFRKPDMDKAKRPVGRPTTYSQETADKICELIARGMSLRAICASADMPAGGTVHRWLAEHQDFQDQHARAREEQADGVADEFIDMADSVAPETGEVAKAKLQIDARKWKAAKLAPKKYGEKLELDADMRVKVETRSLEDIFK